MKRILYVALAVVLTVTLTRYPMPLEAFDRVDRAKMNMQQADFPDAVEPEESNHPAPSGGNEAEKNPQDKKRGVSGDSQSAANGSDVEINPDGILVLVNKANSLSPSYVPPDLVKAPVPFTFSQDSPKRMMRQEAAAALGRMFDQAKSENIILYGVSGYRSYQTQQQIFNARVSQRGEQATNRTTARPGQREHQTGLAMDITCPSAGQQLSQGFGLTREGQWVARNAQHFGFIIRYPQGKESITGYSYEPWHLRYVGVEAAQSITASGLTLEEYLAGQE